LATGSILYDGNNFPWDVLSNGTIGNGFEYTFGGDFGQNVGAMNLDVVVSGTDNLFTGAATGTSAQNRQEIDVEQQGLAAILFT